MPSRNRRFSGRIRALPAQAALRGKSCSQHFGKNRWRAGIGREVGEKPRVLPVRNAGHNDRLKVIENLVDCLAFVRNRRRQLRDDVAGLRLRSNRMILDRKQIVCHPVGELLRVSSKLFKLHNRNLDVGDLLAGGTVRGILPPGGSAFLNDIAEKRLTASMRYCESTICCWLFHELDGWCPNMPDFPNLAGVMPKRACIARVRCD